MGSAFWFLMRRSARNRLISQLNRLKEPRYAIALVVGFGYIWFFLFNRPTGQVGTGGSLAIQTIIPLLGSIGLFIAVARWWAFGGDRRALSFSPAEIHFLFPAPITRRALIHWKLFRWQIVIVINALIWMLIARRTQPPIPVPLYIVSLWVLFSTLSMHRLGSALTKAGVATHWRTGVKRQAIPLILVVAAVTSVLVAVSPRWAELRSVCCGRAFWPLLEEVLRQPAAAVVLFPFQLLMAPVGALSLGGWAGAIVPAFGLLLLHYLWVMRSQVAFEEAAIAASAETVDRIARFKGKQKGIPRKAGRTLPLKSTGWPGTAIVWKNMIAITRGTFSRSFIIIMMLLAAAYAATMGTQDRTPVAVALGSTALAVAAILSFLGPTWIRNDLRSDMNHLALLRTLPLEGRTIVKAEIIGSTLALTGLQLILLMVGYVGLAGSTEMSRYGSLEMILLLAVPAGLIVNAIGMTIQNAAALLFPSWIRFDSGRPGGFETLGQNILSSLFTVFLSALALAGPVATGWFLWTRMIERFGNWTYLPVMTGVALVGWLELRGLMAWLGRVFERTESIT
jgi:ABC-2 type transport system permease protein